MWHGVTWLVNYSYIRKKIWKLIESLDFAAPAVRISATDRIVLKMESASFAHYNFIIRLWKSGSVSVFTLIYILLFFLSSTETQ